mmetsp:Transcript_51888/g.82776  ORF Transcript_51888/g.82776 Transcript_51888/m.82776 type:complete len:597 (+) Transcript_51888:27-1817(+)
MYALASLAALVQLGSSSVIDRPDSIVQGWTELKKTDGLQQIKLTFALKNENVDLLHQTLLDVSTPGNPEYGNHKTVDELYAMTAPSAVAIDAIQDWLFTNFEVDQIIRETPNEDLWSVITDIQSAEKLLNCEYYDYLSDIDGKTIVSRVKLGTDYNVDEAVAKHLYFVSPTHRFPYLQSRVRASLGAGEVNPTKLRALYNIGSAGGKSSNNSQGIASFRDQYYDLSDCKAMWEKYNIDPCNVTNVPSNEPTGNHLEAELDTQYISSMGQAIPMQVWWTKGVNFEDALLEWAQNVLASKTAPPLFSVSYGGPESEFGEAYVTKLNNQLMMLGTAGYSILFAAGDSGAGGGCSSDQPFNPDYPASSPYVTAVGGVTGGTAGKTPVGESVWIDGGGGFSNYAPRQSWQQDAVAYYLSNENSLPDSSQYNASGRGFPDIAAQSVDFEIFVNGKTEAVSGTSCASPTAGGIFALLNDLRAQNKMAKLGFLNPFIYQTAAVNATAFNDCTEGYNKGCSPGVNRGFNAYAKWDPASGYGSPNYAVLKERVLATGQQTIKHEENKLKIGKGLIREKIENGVKKIQQRILNRLTIGKEPLHGVAF